jgi:hypothetical protein
MRLAVLTSHSARPPLAPPPHKEILPLLPWDRHPSFEEHVEGQDASVLVSGVQLQRLSLSPEVIRPLVATSDSSPRAWYHWGNIINSNVCTPSGRQPGNNPRSHKLDDKVLVNALTTKLGKGKSRDHSLDCRSDGILSSIVSSIVDFSLAEEIWLGGHSRIGRNPDRDKIAIQRCCKTCAGERCRHSSP